MRLYITISMSFLSFDVFNGSVSLLIVEGFVDLTNLNPSLSVEILKSSLTTSIIDSWFSSESKLRSSRAHFQSNCMVSRVSLLLNAQWAETV